MNYTLINTDYIESVAGNDKETIIELITLFRDQVAEFSQEMRSLLNKKDYFALGLLAHKAKSSIAIMGMAELAALLKTFELEARESLNTGQYATYISRFESDTSRALEELEDYISKI